MKITIESTEKITSLEIREGQHGISMPARIWEGFTESGVPVHCFITRIAPTIKDTPENAEQFREFERELKEQRKAVRGHGGNSAENDSVGMPTLERPHSRWAEGTEADNKKPHKQSESRSIIAQPLKTSAKENISKP